MIEGSAFIDLASRSAGATARQLVQADAPLTGVVSGIADPDACLVEVVIDGSDEPPVVVAADAGLTYVGAPVVLTRDSSGRIVGVKPPVGVDAAAPEGVEVLAVGDAAVRALEARERLDALDLELAAAAEELESSQAALAESLATAEQSIQTAQTRADEAASGAAAARDAAAANATAIGQLTSAQAELAGKAGDAWNAAVAAQAAADAAVAHAPVVTGPWTSEWWCGNLIAKSASDMTTSNSETSNSSPNRFGCNYAVASSRSGRVWRFEVVVSAEAAARIDMGMYYMDAAGKYSSSLWTAGYVKQVPAGSDHVTIVHDFRPAFTAETPGFQFVGYIQAGGQPFTVHSARVVDVTDVVSAQATADAAAQAAAAAQSTADGAQTAVGALSKRADALQSTAEQAKREAASAAGIAEGKSTVFIQSEAPAASYRLPSTLWIDTTGGANTPQRWSGSAWAAVTDKTAVDAAKTAAAAQSTADKAAAAAEAAQKAADAASRAATQAQSTADGKNTITRSALSPSGKGTTVGDVWWRFSSTSLSGPIIGQWTWNGSAWSPSAIDSQIIASLTVDKLAVTGGARFPSVVLTSLVGEEAFLRAVVAQTILVAGDNRVFDPLFSRDEAWNSSVSIVTWDASVAYPGASRSQLFSQWPAGSSNMSIYSRMPPRVFYTPVVPGERIVARCWWKTDGRFPAGQGFSCQVYFYASDYSQGPGNNQGAGARVKPGEAPIGEWFETGGQLTVPDWAAYAVVRPSLYQDPGVTPNSARAWLGRVEIRSAVGSTLIEPGGIATPHLATNSVDARVVNGREVAGAVGEFLQIKTDQIVAGAAKIAGELLATEIVGKHFTGSTFTFVGANGDVAELTVDGVSITRAGASSSDTVLWRHLATPPMLRVLRQDGASFVRRTSDLWSGNSWSGATKIVRGGFALGSDGNSAIVPVSGWYRCMVRARARPANTSGAFGVGVMVNNSISNGSVFVLQSYNGGSWALPEATGLRKFNAGDVIRIGVFNNQTVTITFEGYELGLDFVFAEN